MRIADRIAGLLLLLFGIYVVVGSLQFDYMVDNTPGPGFIPFWIGLLVSLLSLFPIVSSFKKSDSEKPNPIKSGDLKPVLVFIGGGVLVMLVTPVAGLMIPLGLMVGANAWFMGTKNWKTLVGITVLTPVFMYYLFDSFLGVPFPKGFLGF